MALRCAGFNNVDLAAAEDLGIAVVRVPSYSPNAVAEHTLALILTLNRKTHRAYNRVREGNFALEGLLGYTLHGKTVGIIGLGRIGKKVARRVLAFEARVQYYDIMRLTQDEEDALGVRFVLLDELLRTSDVVTVHVPLNDATRGLMSTREFALMKPGAVFVNTCRGPVVDERALEKALTSGHLGGAGLDVLVDEPPSPSHPLFQLDNVIITPHMAGPTWENWPRAFRNGFDNIQRVAAGRLPLWVIPELRG